ncbi:MAG: hypothetical protein ACI9KE_006390 [Polyangiales bacterium]|jgi:hypothetical protein
MSENPTGSRSLVCGGQDSFEEASGDSVFFRFRAIAENRFHPLKNPSHLLKRDLTVFDKSLSKLSEANSDWDGLRAPIFNQLV